MNQLFEFKEIVLFGTGVAAPRALEYFIKKGFIVKYFCDNDARKIGNKFHGVDILSPNNLKNETGKKFFFFEMFSLNKSIFPKKTSTVCLQNNYQWVSRNISKAISPRTKYMNLKELNS